MERREQRFVVVGQIGQDLALQMEKFPTAGTTGRVAELRWLLGGKGANQAVGLRQLGADVALIGVVGADLIGSNLLSAARTDGIDVRSVASRGSSALLVDVVDRRADRQLLEYVPTSSLVTTSDIDGAVEHIRRAGTVCLQAQQPSDVLIHAAQQARRLGARVAVDGAADSESSEELIALTDTLRADATEAEMLIGFPVDDEQSAREAGTELLRRGLSVVALEVPARGDLVTWRGGARLFPHDDENVVDRTGAGDAFFAGLVRGLAWGWSAENAGALAAAAAAATVTHLGGRPDIAHLIGWQPAPES
jgi:ribokinase